MKNTLISILVIIILLLGFFFIKEKSSRDTMINEWPETVPATPTNNNQQSNSNPCSPSIVVSAPAAGASYTVGQQVTIEWTTCNVQKVLIGLVSGGKDHGYITQNPISVSTGSYQWTATNPGKDFTDLNTNSYQIAVESEDGSVMAKSGTFSVTTPSQTSSVKTYSGNGFKIDYPKDITVTEEEAEGGPYKVVYFTDNAIVNYIWNPDFHEQHAMSIDYELVGTKTANGNTFKVYSVYGETNNRFYLRSGNVAYEISFRDNTRMSLDTFDLI